jgi:hypothetical protein
VQFKHKLAIATTTLAAAAFTGGAYAASQDSPVNQRQTFLNDVAKRLNVSPQALSSALTAAFQDQLNAAVNAGRLTQSQADRLAQRAHNGGARFWLGGPPRLFGPRQVLPGTPARPNAKLEGPLATAASYLGVAPAKLFQQIEAGKSLADIAKARGKDSQGLQQAMIASIKARLDQAVADKRITSSEEQQLLKQLPARIADQVKDRDPELPDHGFGIRIPGALDGLSAPVPDPTD